MSGALAERVFADKITGVGFTPPTILDRQRFGIDDVARYPLFTPELIDLMRQLLRPEQHHEVATSVTLVAHRPAADHDPATGPDVGEDAR